MKVLTDNQYYSDIANAIRAKLGTEETFLPSEMAAAIASISSSGADDDSWTTKEIDVTNNIGLATYADYSESNTTLTFSSTNSATPSFICSYPFDKSVYRIPAGCRLDITFSETGLTQDEKFQTLMVFKEIDGATVSTDDHLVSGSNIGYRFKNIVALDYQNNTIHAKTQDESGKWGFWGQNSYSYENTGEDDVWFAFGLQDNQGVWKNSDNKLATAKAWVSENLTFILTKISS